MLLLRDYIVALWLGPGQTIPLGLAVTLVVWSMLMAFSSPYFTVQNSVGHLGLQLIGWAVFAALSIPLKFSLYGVFGLLGVPLGGSIAYLLVLVPVAILGYRRTLMRVGIKNEA